MNANELADYLENDFQIQEAVIDMLRQQQAEIEALKKEAALQRLSDFTQEAESFDRTASHMAGEYVSYNEPVAWMEIEHGGFTEYKVWREPVSSKSIPLYTHPAKESKAKDRFSNYESICAQCGTTIYKPAFKTLTDEEILFICDDHRNKYGGIEPIGFARAILKKASEK